METNGFMEFLYAPPMRRFEIFLFPVGAQKMTYQEAVDCIKGLGFDPFQGRKLIYHLFELWRVKEITFPPGEGHIIGLAEKEKLPSDGVNGSRRYGYPIIFRSLMGAGRLSEDSFSETDADNDFSNTYIICIKKKTKEGG